MKEKTKIGKVEVTVQTEDRLKAITNLAIAVRCLAEALNNPVHIEVKDCTLKANDIAMLIKTNPNISRTEIKEIIG